MIYLIVIVVAGLIFKFLYDINSQQEKLLKEGGMANKYRTLIDKILSEDARTEIIKEDKDSIIISLNTIGGSTTFILTQTFGYLTIEWKEDNRLHGKHKLEWDFPEYSNQNDIFNKIKENIIQYLKKVLPEPEDINEVSEIYKSETRYTVISEYPNFVKFCELLHPDLKAKKNLDEEEVFEYVIPITTFGGKVLNNDWQFYFGLEGDVLDYPNFYFRCKSKSNQIIEGAKQIIEDDLSVREYEQLFNNAYLKILSKPEYIKIASNQL